MKFLVDSIEKWPQWLRWVLFLPVGLGCGVLLERSLNAGFILLGSPNTDVTLLGILFVHTKKLISAWWIVTFPAIIAPHHRAVALTFFALGLLLESIAPLYRLLSGFPVLDVIYAIGAFGVDFGGGLLGLLTVRHYVRVAAGLQKLAIPVSREGAA